MKTLQHIFCLTIFVALTSCNEPDKIFPKSTFDTPFPKRNKDLTNILDDHLTIKSGNDTLTLRVFAFKNYNLITNSKTGDTLFYGTGSKFRGLYYFSQQLNDTSYWIYAVKIKDNLIYGLNSSWTQTMFVDTAIESGKHKKLVKYIDTDKKIIRLHPDKKELKNLFTTIIDNMPPDTILHFEISSTLINTTKIATQIDSEDFEFLSKAYPNPTTDFINIELQQKNISYQLIDLNGKLVLEGQFANNINKIDLSKQPNGVYGLILVNPKDKQKETIKIIKTK